MVAIGPVEIAAVVRSLGMGQLARYGVNGASQTDKFEAELAAHMGAPYALAVNSGTSALLCAFSALGVGPGDEVLVPAYTWLSTAAAAVAVGAVPVLVEIDETLTMDPADLEAKITERSKVIVPVHMLNLPADMDRIMEIATRRGLFVVEDACQAIGVTHKGRKLGSIGDAGTYSFNQHKNIKSGEGGAVVFKEARHFQRAVMMHDVGSYTRDGFEASDEPAFVGLNLRMPELCSAMLRPQLRRLDKQMKKRAARRAMMLDAFGDRVGLAVSPHHDASNAVGLTVSFDDPAEAEHFAQARGVNRLIDTGRHVYSNWQPIMEQRTVDARRNPWTESSVEYVESCPNTIRILERTCSVTLDPDVPMPAMKRIAAAIAEQSPMGETVVDLAERRDRQQQAAG